MPADTLTRAGSLHGRDIELSQITEALDRTGRGYGTAVVIEGPTGSGKTRLLRELIALAQRRHCVVFEPCWWMTSELSPPMNAEPSLLVEQFARFSFQAPVVIACDDVRAVGHQIGPVLRSLTKARPILCAVTRTAGSANAADLFGMTMIRLGPLSGPAAHDMLTDLLSATPTRELSALAAAAFGSPAAIVDLADGLVEEKLVEIDDGLARLLQPALPRRLIARLDRQLADLSRPTRQLVQVGAAIGVSFTLLDLADLVHETAAGLLPAVEEALDSGLLVSDGDRLAFSHQLVRRVVAGSVPLSVRSALQREVDRTANPRPATPEPPSYDQPDHLSETERAIARFVGQAMTNREIAARMFLSPHTINYHLRQIFRKLEIHSRIELAQRRIA
jgi:DNA-binding CsgD family transcriptional regulator